MAALKSGVSRCGLCRFYDHEGRRGGMCSLLNAPVVAQWEACRLAASPFEAGCEREGAIAPQPDRWLVPETASELAAHPTVFSPTLHSALHSDLAKGAQYRNSQYRD